MGHVDNSQIAPLFANTTPGVTADANAVDPAISALIVAINENFDSFEAFKASIELPIPDQSIVSRHLRNLAVTNPKLAPLAVTADKIADGTISTQKLADLVITAQKIANNAILERHMSNASVSRRTIQAGAVGANEIDPSILVPISNNTINVRLDQIDEQLADMAINVKNYGAVGDGEVDDTTAVLAALYKDHGDGETIFFPTGTYLIKQSLINLPPGTFIKGAGPAATTLLIDVATADYLFKTNLNTGFEDIRIKFANEFRGDAILHDPGYISATNGDTYHFERSYKFRNVEINFPYNSGYGTGIHPRVRNFDDDGNPYPANVITQLVYFYVDNLEVSYGNCPIKISLEQRNPVNRQIWATATRINKLRSNTCAFGPYILLTNTSSQNTQDISDINFNDVEIQCAQPNTLTSTPAQTMPIYIKGTSSRTIRASFTNITIWDSTNGESGYLENCDVRLLNAYFGYTVKVAAGYKRGFSLSNASVDVDVDVRRIRRTDTTTGNISEIRPIDGGYQFFNTPDGENGYNARGQLREEIITGTNFSRVWLEAYDKNNTTEGYLELARGTGFKGVTRGIFNLMSRYTDGTMRSVVNAGSVGTIYNDSTVDQGFYAGNGMYVSFERHTVSVDTSAAYQTVNITLTESFTYTPFLVNVALELIDGGTSSAEDVTIRQAQVTSTTNVRLILKHSKSSSISLRFAITVCGYKSFA